MVFKHFPSRSQALCLAVMLLLLSLTAQKALAEESEIYYPDEDSNFSYTSIIGVDGSAVANGTVVVEVRELEGNPPLIIQSASTEVSEFGTFNVDLAPPTGGYWPVGEFEMRLIELGTEVDSQNINFYDPGMPE